ncbi:MAG: bifunctional DNA primase/polymerase [Planctomycetota bacterium]|jgi:hypothetical protein|nr:bifunctional DNA primase/polymerase [Planctomycetota bacterium]
MTADGVSLPLVDAALAYRAAGLSVLAVKADKAPFFSWSGCQAEIAPEREIAEWFFRPQARRLAVVCGAVSGGLECIDIDAGGSAWPAWRELVEAEAPGLLSRLAMETSPRGGRHILYRCPDVAIPGPAKLAMRPAPTPDNPRALDTLIETRGEGAYFCCAPSDGYAVVQGALTAIGGITASERNVLIRCARILNEAVQPNDRPAPVRTAMPGCGSHRRPGDDYNAKCDFAGMAAPLERHGWKIWRKIGENVAWTRPGKERGVSATLRRIDGIWVFYVFTSSTVFDSARAYSPFQLYATLEHGGDFALAAADLARRGYGRAKDDDFDVEAFAAGNKTEADTAENGPKRISDPGPFPDRLLRVGGFLGEFADHINRKAIKRQPVIALGAAIAALGTLAGRKVMGITGLRTNFYVLGVAESGDGKDKPREIVRQLLYESGNDSLYTSDRLKSDAAIRAALEANPCVLFLLDEIGELLETIKNARHSPWLKNIITELLMLYSSAQSSGIKMGGYADPKKTAIVDCPHVCLFGTSVPASVFRAMTMDSVTGGLIGRLLIFESAFENPRKQKPSSEPIPPVVLDAARWWRDFFPGGNLTGNHAGSVADPMPVGESAAATDIFDRLEEECRREISELPVEWGGPYKRVEENARKLALLAACSDSHETPYVGEKAASWATELSLYLTRRLVYLASINVAENETHDRRNRVLKLIDSTGIRGMTKSELLRRLPCIKSREMNEILETLLESALVDEEKIETKTKAKYLYKTAHETPEGNNSNNSRIIQSGESVAIS